MKKIAVSDILDDMELGKPLIGGNGKILMTPGTKLKKSMIDRLKSWGVVFAFIQTDEDGPNSTVDKTQELKRLKAKFKSMDENLRMKKLYKELRHFISRSV